MKSIVLKGNPSSAPSRIAPWHAHPKGLRMPAQGHNIIVIGTSAGGLEALETLINQLPQGLPAPIFVVQHLAPESDGSALLLKLGASKAFRCKLAEDGEAFQPGTIYIAPPDKHMLVRKETLAVVRGARENRYRPSIDPLFRSAAVAHSTRVIGVLLTGLLDDGTSGIIAIKRCGGITLVQDPKEAAYPDMPQSALNSRHVDFSVPLSEMGSLITSKVSEAPRGNGPIPEDIRTEAEIAERVVSTIETLDSLGAKSPYTCPDCGGTLWEMGEPGVQRFRCHTGHAYTARSLLAEQSEKVEETLWVSLRSLEEKRNLLKNMQQDERSGLYADRINEIEVHIHRIRDLLHAPESALVHSPTMPPESGGSAHVAS
jgi:two-component system, chemotaxis family, protein-glutamate methylesterase/glutaminase